MPETFRDDMVPLPAEWAAPDPPQATAGPGPTALKALVPLVLGLASFEAPVAPPPQPWPRCQAAVTADPESAVMALRAQLEHPTFEAGLQRHVRQTFTAADQARLAAMPYAEFIGTKYWWLVCALLLKARRDRCQDCGGAGPLDVHHLTYTHLGGEIFHLDDLALVCHGCHVLRHQAADGWPQSDAEVPF